MKEHEMKLGNSRSSARNLSDLDDSYTLKAIHLIPHNVSAWNYLRGYVIMIRKGLSG